jgi:hypothetical protein
MLLVDRVFIKHTDALIGLNENCRITDSIDNLAEDTLIGIAHTHSRWNEYKKIGGQKYRYDSQGNNKYGFDIRS